MTGIQYLGDWIIDWDTATAYQLRGDDDPFAPTQTNPIYTRYNKTTDQEDEVYESELPAKIKSFINPGE